MSQSQSETPTGPTNYDRPLPELDHAIDPETELDQFPLLYSGKVRNLYRYSDDPSILLMVATDAISAFDHVLPSHIPGRGIILTQMSLWWKEQFADLVANDVISTQVPRSVRGRGVLAEQLAMLPIEVIVRGYLTGSALAEYQQKGSVGGIELPTGLTDGAKLPRPIFTPTTKAETGSHDQPMTSAEVDHAIGPQQHRAVAALAIELFSRAQELAEQAGLILADTKFEFGVRPDGALVLADEVLTPDSSRFFDAATFDPPRVMHSYDKQVVRDWLTKESGWDRSGSDPAPPLPEGVIEETQSRYRQAYETLTGRSLADFLVESSQPSVEPLNG